MASILLPMIFHAGAASIMIWAYNHLSMNPLHNLIMQRKGGHWGFLTIQGLVFACATCCLGLLCDVIPGFKALKTTKRTFHMISMALACTISSIYWTLIALAPGLMLPRRPPGSENPFNIMPGEPSSESDLVRIPLHLDLALHAVPGISMALDFMLFEKKFTRHEAFTRAPLLTLLFVFWYGGLTEYLGALNNGGFPCPFLTLSPFEIRIAIYVGASLLAFLSFQLLNAIHPGRPLLAQWGLIQDERSKLEVEEKNK